MPLYFISYGYKISVGTHGTDDCDETTSSSGGSESGTTPDLEPGVLRIHCWEMPNVKMSLVPVKKKSLCSSI